MLTYIEQSTPTRWASGFAELDSGRPTGVLLLVWRPDRRTDTLLVLRYRLGTAGPETLGLETLSAADWPEVYPGHIPAADTTLTEIVDDPEMWPASRQPLPQRGGQVEPEFPLGRIIPRRRRTGG